jgi:hypothetical protein
MKHIKIFEKFSREEIANTIGEPKSTFDDSSTLGGIADDMTIDQEIYEEAVDTAEWIWEEFQLKYDFSPLFTMAISDETDYNREEKLINDVLSFAKTRYEDYNIFSDKMISYIENELKKMSSNKIKNAR